jgi:hypothetical protein
MTDNDRIKVLTSNDEFRGVTQFIIEVPHSIMYQVANVSTDYNKTDDILFIEKLSRFIEQLERIQRERMRDDEQLKSKY